MLLPDTFLTEDSNPITLNLPAPGGLDFPWETLEAMIQGRSSIDLSRMPVRNRDEAFSMVYHYGFDLSLPEDAAEIEGYFMEAVKFIEHRFLTPSIDWAALGEIPLSETQIPRALTESRNVLDLIVIASQADHPHRHWACALLKVIHTLVYIQASPLYKYHVHASESILSRFRDILHPQEDGTVVLQGEAGRTLRLYAFEAKQHKPRESILLKLLCKKENVAEHIWDLVGVRLITFHPAEALLAVDILREQKVLLFPNVIPSRSRNTLFDFEDVRQQYETRLSQYEQGKLSLNEVMNLFQSADIADSSGSHADQNPLSSPQYRSMHITCRKLLRLKPAEGMAETRFAFPYEIQILDKAAYLDSKVGHGAHALYKQRQLFTARRRVLGMLLEQQQPLAAGNPPQAE